MTKSAMITLCGRPNVGKSTLANALVGEKVAIVSDKPQTTRNRICAIAARGETQFVFVDTPGFHKPRTRLGDYMVNVVRESVADVDCVLLLVEPVAKIGEAEAELIDRIKALDVPAALVINKMEELCTELEKYAEEGPHLFPEDMITDQPERQVCAELLREKLLLCLDKEIPHGTAVEVTKFSERENGVIDLDVTIYCEKESHKGIIIGKKGAMLKKIGELARADIEAFMGTRVYLQTWVKVKENWRDSVSQLRSLGYGG